MNEQQHYLPHDMTLVPMGYSTERFLENVLRASNHAPTSYERGRRRKLNISPKTVAIGGKGATTAGKTTKSSPISPTSSTNTTISTTSSTGTTHGHRNNNDRQPTSMLRGFPLD